MSDFVLILSLLYCWLSGGSALVLCPAGDKPKNSTVKLGWWKFYFSRKTVIFATCATVMTMWKCYWTHKFSVDSRYEKKFFLMFKIKCKNDFQGGVSKMKIKTWFVCFFKCLFVLRLGAVIFELDKVSMSNSVKFEFRSMTLKIEEEFEKKNKILSQKLAKRTMNLVNRNDHNQCKISYMRKKYIFL